MITSSIENPDLLKIKTVNISLDIPVGLIGVGHHGSRYMHHLLSDKTGGKLVAISRRNKGKGQQLASKYSIQFYPDYLDLLADSAIKAVIIVTPPSLHHVVAINAINHGKAVLLEKPISLNQTQGQQIVNAVRYSKVPFMVAHTLRYEPAIQQLCSLTSFLSHWEYLSCTMRFARRPTSFETNSPETRQGVLMEFGIHLLDLVRVLSGDEIRSVSADLYRHPSHQAELRAHLKLVTTSGLPCFIEISQVSRGRVTRAEIIGSDGQLFADWTTGNVQRISSDNQVTNYPCPPRPTLISLLREFFHAIHTKGVMPITAEDGLRAVEIAEACYQSCQQSHTG